MEISLLGCRGVGADRARALIGHPGVARWHLWDAVPGAARELAAELKDAVVHTGPEALLSTPDAVFLDVDPAAAVVEAALARDVPTLVEAPAAGVAARGTADRLHVAAPHRFRRRYLAAKQLVADGSLGRLDGVTATVQTAGGPSGVAPSLAVLVDLTLWLLDTGAPQDLAVRRGPTWMRALLTFAEARVASLAVSGLRPAGTGDAGSLDLFGSSGVALIDDSGRELRLARPPAGREDGGPVRDPLRVPVAGRVWGPLRTETEEFLATVTTGRRSPLLCDARQAAVTRGTVARMTGSPARATAGI